MQQGHIRQLMLQVRAGLLYIPFVPALKSQDGRVPVLDPRIIISRYRERTRSVKNTITWVCRHNTRMPTDYRGMRNIVVES